MVSILLVNLGLASDPVPNRPTALLTQGCTAQSNALRSLLAIEVGEGQTQHHQSSDRKARLHSAGVFRLLQRVNTSVRLFRMGDHSACLDACHNMLRQSSLAD